MFATFRTPELSDTPRLCEGVSITLLFTPSIRTPTEGSLPLDALGPGRAAGGRTGGRGDGASQPCFHGGSGHSLPRGVEGRAAVRGPSAAGSGESQGGGAGTHLHRSWPFPRRPGRGGGGDSDRGPEDARAAHGREMGLPGAERQPRPGLGRSPPRRGYLVVREGARNGVAPDGGHVRREPHLNLPHLCRY